MQGARKVQGRRVLCVREDLNFLKQRSRLPFFNSLLGMVVRRVVHLDQLVADLRSEVLEQATRGRLGLVDGGRYRVTVIDDTTIQLSDSRIIDSLSVAAAVSVAASSSFAVRGGAAGGATAVWEELQRHAGRLGITGAVEEQQLGRVVSHAWLAPDVSGRRP